MDPVAFKNFEFAPLIDARAQKALLKPDPHLEHALANTAANGLPPISVLPLAGQFLTILTQAVGAKSVLEVGTLGGYSSICFAKAGAKVTSIEIDPKIRDVALENVKGHEVEILLGDAEQVMPRMVQEGRKFDLVFLDGEFASQWLEFSTAVDLTRPDGCIFLDDVVCSMFAMGDVQKISEDMEEQHETILDKIGKEERVLSTLVPTTAVHPLGTGPAIFNGFVFAKVKGD